MFGYTTKVLFPDECRVLEITPGSRYVYPIFKNGSTSLAQENYRELSLNEVAEVKTIDVFVRDPHERFLSGVHTYITKLGPNIDKQTALQFVRDHLYLNRHYCPQMFWLINLQRFTSAKLSINPVSNLNLITRLTANKSTVDPEVVNWFTNDIKTRFYNEIDEVLTVNLINQTVTFADIVCTAQTYYAELWNELIVSSKDIVDVLSKA